MKKATAKLLILIFTFLVLLFMGLGIFFSTRSEPNVIFISISVIGAVVCTIPATFFSIALA